MKFLRYMHIEKLGREEVEGILDSPVHVFPKIDGANVQIYRDDDQIYAGTRNRQLGSIETASWRGLPEYLRSLPGLIDFFKKYPEFRLHAEWLVPHTLKDYKDDAWNKAYVFDVSTNGVDERPLYVPYGVYVNMLEEFSIPYIPCMSVVTGGVPVLFENMIKENTFLMKPGCIGEGIVLKSYDYTNKFGRTVWAKLINKDFALKHCGCKSAVVSGDKTIEDMIVDKFVTDAVVEKELSKLVLQTISDDTPDVTEQKHIIPALLGSVFHTLVVEDIWHALKTFKAHQVIDFRRLQKVCTNKVKELKPDLF